jgi:predicted chitinase
MIDTKLVAETLRSPEHNVSANWPLIETALSSLGISSRLSLIAALGTIRVECPSFAPSTEKYNGDPAVYFARYDGRKDLGNNEPGDGYRFRGRGYIQITGRANYHKYSRAAGVDLVNNPDAALDPHVSATIFANFFHDQKIAEAAEQENWLLVRKLVNGGVNGYTDFSTYVFKLKAVLPQAAA